MDMLHWRFKYRLVSITVWGLAVASTYVIEKASRREVLGCSGPGLKAKNEVLVPSPSFSHDLPSPIQPVGWRYAYIFMAINGDRLPDNVAR